MAWPYPEKETVKQKAKNTKPKKSTTKADLTERKKNDFPNRIKDPMDGVTLQMILEQLESKYGWDELAAKIRINCFAKDPSIKSSLKFVRRTPWARAKVEALYLESDWAEKE